jgi:hypothetical protein
METLARRARSRTWDESEHPREPAGSPGGGEFTSGGGGGRAGGGSEKPAAGEKTKGKFKSTDFNKGKVRLDNDTSVDKARSEKFLERWNEKINEAPEEFRDHFLGGLDGTMRLGYSPNSDKISIDGRLEDDGKEIGTYQREINLKDNKAYSAYFNLKKSSQGGNVGKKLLAANVAMYQKLGLDKVEVTANIDVGGYAWAKYGYVPTASSWRDLSSDLRNKLSGDRDRASHTATGSGYTPESWEEIGEHDQSQIETAWTRSTRDEFISSEEQNWRDSGGALDDAKSNLADDFNDRDGGTCAEAALKSWREQRAEEGDPAVPFTDEQILAGIDMNYDRDYEGRNDVTVSFSDQRLDQMQPEGYDPAQQTLPGIEPIKPNELLSESAREEIDKALTEAFNTEAEDRAQDADPPDFSDQVAEYQEEYWSSMSDRDKYDWAERNSELPEYPIEDDDEEPQQEMELPEPSANDALMKLARSSDPKALWAIADSAQGKQLLLGKSWSGVLDLKDKQSMDRFHAYVGK